MSIDRNVTLCVCFSLATSVSFLAHGQTAGSPRSGGFPSLHDLIRRPSPGADSYTDR